MRINSPDHHPRHTRINERSGTGRRSPYKGTGFQGYIDGSTGDVSASVSNGVHFRMGFASF
jgi:hypothetical protein